MAITGSMDVGISARRRGMIWLLSAAALGIFAPAHSATAAPPEQPIAQDGHLQRAVSYLAVHAARWSPENKCFSCHNNGDAARALLAAGNHGLRFQANALHETLSWLSRPSQWEHNQGDDAASDKQLAAIQFAAALSAACDAGVIKDRRALGDAAQLVAGFQLPDGSWQVGASGAVGGPTTYGPALATSVSRRVLLHADPTRFARAIGNADRWLRGVDARTVLDCAAVYGALRGEGDDAAQSQCRRCLAVITDGQSASGGWGPYANSAAEPFDTAVVLLALLADQEPGRHAALIQLGHRFLLNTQLADGSWPETTRPPGAESYAQRISTTAWATLALLKSQK